MYQTQPWQHDREEVERRANEQYTDDEMLVTNPYLLFYSTRFYGGGEFTFAFRNLSCPLWNQEEYPVTLHVVACETLMKPRVILWFPSHLRFEMFKPVELTYLMKTAMLNLQVEGVVYTHMHEFMTVLKMVHAKRLIAYELQFVFPKEGMNADTLRKRLRSEIQQQQHMMLMLELRYRRRSDMAYTWYRHLLQQAVID